MRYPSFSAVRRSRLPKHAAAALGLLLMMGTSCDFLQEVLEGFGDCTAYEVEYESYFLSGGNLRPVVPDSVDDYAMAMILNTAAVNELFRRLGDTDFPVLSTSVDVLGMEISVGVEPDIPNLSIGGTASCPDCFHADVDITPYLAINGYQIPAGAGVLGVQMPAGMVPIDDRQTELVAFFQELEVTDLDVDLGNDLANAYYDYVEPVLLLLLTEYLQWRFEDALIATFDSWPLGEGEVLLAPRGPFIYPEFETMVMPIQTNLILDSFTPLEDQIELPDGADIGIVFHPNLLVAMARRMNYENVIPEGYDGDGNAAPDGPVKLTISHMDSDPMGLLRTNARLWMLEDLCGTADMAVSMGISADTESFTLAVSDVAITEGEGFGAVLAEADWMISEMTNSLVNVLEITINYDQMLGGEEGELAEMSPFQFNIDGRGMTFYFNLLQGF